MDDSSISKTRTIIIAFLHVWVVVFGVLTIKLIPHAHLNPGLGVLFTFFSFWILMTARLEGFRPQSLYFIFISSVILFILGRFILSLFKDGYDAFSMDWFYINEPTNIVRTNMAVFVFSTIGHLHLGALFAKFIKPRFNLIQTPGKGYCIEAILFLILGSVCLVPFVVHRVKLYVDFGYYGLFMAQSEYELDLSGIYETFLMLALGLAVLAGNKRLVTLVLVVAFFAAIIRLGLGQRTSFFGWALAFIWILGFFYQKKLRFSFLIFIGMAGVFLSQLILLLRESADSSVEYFIAESVISFMHQQGATIAMLAVLPEISDWPTGGFLGKFFPLIGFLASRLFDLNSCEFTNFGCHLASTLNREWFMEGKAIGWSLFSDIFVLLGGNVVFASLAMLILGFIGQAWVRISSASPTMMLFLVAASPKIVVLPRYGIESIFVLFWYLGFFHFSYKLFYKILYRE